MEAVKLGFIILIFSFNCVPVKLERKTNLKLEDILIAVKTSRRTQNNTLPTIIRTWFQKAKSQTWFFTDQNSPLHQRMTDDHIVVTKCLVDNERNPCCQLSAAIKLYTRTKNKWFCNFEDDTYVNVPRLVQELQKYNYWGEWYLGKKYAKRRTQYKGYGEAFWYADNGAGWCLSRTLAKKVQSFISHFGFVNTCVRFGQPGDVTLGFIIGGLLGVNLTTISGFHSNKDHMNHIPLERLSEQISFSYGGDNSQNNVVSAPGWTQSQDPTRFASLHCFLFPCSKICKDYPFKKKCHCNHDETPKEESEQWPDSLKRVNSKTKQQSWPRTEDDLPRDLQDRSSVDQYRNERVNLRSVGQDRDSSLAQYRNERTDLRSLEQERDLPLGQYSNEITNLKSLGQNRDSSLTQYRNERTDLRSLEQERYLQLPQYGNERTNLRPIGQYRDKSLDQYRNEQDLRLAQYGNERTDFRPPVQYRDKSFDQFQNERIDLRSLERDLPVAQNGHERNNLRPPGQLTDKSLELYRNERVDRRRLEQERDLALAQYGNERTNLRPPEQYKDSALDQYGNERTNLRPPEQYKDSALDQYGNERTNLRPPEKYKDSALDQYGNERINVRDSSGSQYSNLGTNLGASGQNRDLSLAQNRRDDRINRKAKWRWTDSTESLYKNKRPKVHEVSTKKSRDYQLSRRRSKENFRTNRERWPDQRSAPYYYNERSRPRTQNSSPTKRRTSDLSEVSGFENERSWPRDRERENFDKKWRRNDPPVHSDDDYIEQTEKNKIKPKKESEKKKNPKISKDIAQLLGPCM